MTTNSLELGDIPRAVLAVTLRQQEVTRKQLVDELAVSFPSITAALAELDEHGYVHEVRRVQGARGRATLVYGVAESAGWVLGIDIGSTQVTCLAQSLDGVELARLRVPVPHDPETAARAAASLIDRALASTATPPLAVAMAVNQIVPHPLRAPSIGVVERTRAAQIVDLVMASCSLSPEVPVAVENNVNCAAVAEHEDGAMRGIDNCAYLQIGVGLGLGFFVEGALVRGASGASGEVAQIPMSWDATVESPRYAIELRYGSAGLLAHAADSLPGDPPGSVEELFARAQAGDGRAQTVMRAHAISLGRIAAAITTLIDPDVLVVGGGLPKNAAFVELVRDEFGQQMPHTELRASAKGTAATVQGAVLIARDLALTALLEHHHRPLVPRPVLWSPLPAAEEVSPAASAASPAASTERPTR
ncbi:MAG TPA: ROK family protein [Gryllotalpicola sp.]